MARRASVLKVPLGEKSKALLTVKKCLERPLKETLAHWRRQVEITRVNLVIESNFIQKRVAAKLLSIFTIAQANHMRHMQTSFNSWKMITFVEKKAENRRL